MSGRATASAELAEQLRADVLDGRLPPGTPLREETLAEQHGVSRHTVRTALALLVTDRLAQAVPYSGVRVAALDDAEVRSLQDLRRAVESEAVRLLHERHGQAWPARALAVLDGLVGALADAVAGGDRLAVLREHAALHHGLVALAGSTRLTEVSDGLGAEVRLFTAHLHLHDQPGDLVEQHRTYLADVRRRGPLAVRDHLAASEHALLSSR